LGDPPEYKRRVFDFEPRGIVVFKALALAEVVILGPSGNAAAVKGWPGSFGSFR